jgi:putative hydrolase of the HAD superfamily
MRFGSPAKEGLLTQKQNGKIKCIIFDFGGVMVIEGLGMVRKKYKEKTGVDLEHIWYNDIRPTWKALEKGWITEDVFWDEFDKAVKQKYPVFDVKEFRRMVFKNQKYDMKVVNLIKDLRVRGYKTALLTNNVKEWVEDWNAKDDLKKYFDVIVSSHEVELVKPNPGIYQITLFKLGAKPEECVFIDDKEKNIRAAEQLGINGVVFDTAEQLKKELGRLLYRNIGLDILPKFRRRFKEYSETANESMQHNVFDKCFLDAGIFRTSRKLAPSELERIRKNGMSRHRYYCPGYMWESGGTSSSLTFKYDKENNIIRAVYHHEDDDRLDSSDRVTRETHRAYYDGTTGELISDITRLPSGIQRRLLKEFKAEDED